MQPPSLSSFLLICHGSCQSTGHCHTASDVYLSSFHSGRPTGCSAYALALWLCARPRLNIL